MPILIQASVAGGNVSLRFPYTPEVIDLLKTIPGWRWNKGARVWAGPENALPILANALGAWGHRLSVAYTPTTTPAVPAMLLNGLRPYQLDGIGRLLSNPGYMLTWEMRVGKTRPASAAIAAKMAAGDVQRTLIFSPGGVRHVWAEQLHQQTGLQLRSFSGRTPFDVAEQRAELAVPYGVFGCHFEIAAERKEDLFAIADAGPFGVLVDEIQQIKNRKAPRTKVLHELAKHRNCRFRWGLTGTPMRNRNRDIWAAFEFIQPGSMGPYWTFAKAFCNPPEAPIWMGDFSFKPLGQVCVGDEVIGWEKRTEPVKQQTRSDADLRQTLVRSTVTAISKRVAPIVKITMESGAVLRCTEDHEWLAANNYARKASDSPRDLEIRRLRETGVKLADLAALHGLSIQSIWRIVHPGKNFEYLPAKLGRDLIFVVDPAPGPTPSPAQARLLGWVAGMYDGEGHGAFISQSSTANPETLERLTLALTELGIPHEVHENRPCTQPDGASELVSSYSAGGVYITGGRDGFMRFLKLVQPTRLNNGWDRALLVGRFRTKDKVVKIEPDGEGEVIGLTTTTGNYVAWGYASKNCGAHEGDYGWEDHENTRTEELAQRLTAVSFRLLRRDVAQWLPKSDRAVFLCDMASADAKKYYALEAQLAGAAGAGLNDSSSPGAMQAMRTLAAVTSASKMNTVIERIEHHCIERGVKLLVFANFHESLRDLWERLEPSDQTTKPAIEDLPVFCAGGWMTPDKRKKVIEQWRQTPGAAVLLANALSSGVGIDLADAEVAVFIELAWVPADFMQAEARIQDVHLGKRTTPPVFEYLVVKRTIDEDMAAKLLEKVKNIEAVVGVDGETKGMADSLHGSGLVGSDRLGLRDTADETVNAAIAGLRARLMLEPAAVSDPLDTTESLAADVSEAWEEDLTNEEEELTT